MIAQKENIGLMSYDPFSDLGLIGRLQQEYFEFAQYTWGVGCVAV
jgi:hypothetical protein